MSHETVGAVMEAAEKYQDQEAFLPNPDAEPASAAHLEEEQNINIDPEKFGTVPEHGGSMKEALQKFKDTPPGTPLPQCLRNLGFTSADEVEQRFGDTNSNAERPLTVLELKQAKREAAKREAERAEAPKPLSSKPEGALSVEAQTASSVEKIVGPTVSMEALIVTEPIRVLRQEALRHTVALQESKPSKVEQPKPKPAHNETIIKKTVLKADVAKLVFIPAAPHIEKINIIKPSVAELPSLKIAPPAEIQTPEDILDFEEQTATAPEIVPLEQDYDNEVEIYPAESADSGTTNEPEIVPPSDEIVIDLLGPYETAINLPYTLETAEIPVDLPNTFEAIDTLIPTPAAETMQETSPENIETTEIIEQAKATIVNYVEIIAKDILPKASQAELVEQLESLEPEQIVEIEAQIEVLSVVADRLHELIIDGVTDSLEVQQIQEFLSEKFQELLIAVGIVPTQELVKAYFAYIYSPDYQVGFIETQRLLEPDSEGTHEKKLFDEQSVFSKAHFASIKLAQDVSNVLGRLALINTAT